VARDVGISMAVLGGVAGVTGIVLLTTSRRGYVTQERLALGPQLSGSGAGLTARLRF
jgi:hypothetical protein